MPSQSRGDWIQTFTGNKFYPLNATVDDIDPVDIAHALSMLCRFGGHTHRFYSVAEHCVLLSYAVPAYPLEALLHDAAEAYLMDLPRPIKQQFPLYREAENQLLQTIFKRFQIPVVPDAVFPTEVADADLRMLLVERSVLMPNTVHRWGIEDLTPLTLPLQIEGWAPPAAEYRFRNRLRELLHARDHTHVSDRDPVEL